MTDEREQDNGPEARGQKHPLWWRILFGRENWYRDVWLAITTGIVVLALAHSDDAIQQQKQGRTSAVQVTCGALSAVIEAGRATLGADVQPPEFRRALERLGLPPRRARSEAAKVAGNAYRKSIADSIERQAHVKGLVQKDGTLDCNKLAQLAKIQ